MGLYDEIICELPLPDLDKHPIESDHVFQTKSFEQPFLSRYRINKNGQILIDYLNGGDEQLKHQEYKDLDNDPFWGKLEFYTYYSKDTPCPNVAVKHHLTYIGYFVDGKLTKLKVKTVEKHYAQVEDFGNGLMSTKFLSNEEAESQIASYLSNE